jgi:hypothetical protein
LGRRWKNGPEKEKKEKEGERGFDFLKTFLNNFSNPFLNQTFYIFSQPLSQIILKTLKATQQQNSCIST